MKKRLRRILEIVGGVILISLGVVMLFTPGQGILTIVAGIFLISPRHGRKIVEWAKQNWNKLKSKIFPKK